MTENPAGYTPLSEPRGDGPGGLLREFRIPWPAANEEALREAAATWHGLAQTIRDSCEPANNAAASLTSGNAGAAIDAFEAYWQRYGGPKNACGGALPSGADACDAMSSACTRYADAVAEIKRKIEEAAAAAGAGLVIGTVGAFVTFGASEAAADGVVAGLVDWAGEQIAELGGMIAYPVSFLSTTLADAIEEVTMAIAVTVGSEGPAVLSAGAFGAINGANSAALTAAADGGIRELFGDKPLSPSETDKDLVAGAAAGGAGGVIGWLSGITQPQLVKLLRRVASSVPESDQWLYTQVMALAHQVERGPGTVSASVLTQAATQIIMTQQVDAGKITQTQIVQKLKRIAEGGQG